MMRRGFTLVEIVVAMTLTLAVFAITLPFVRAQTRALGQSAGRLDADQIARYAQRAIDADLRLATADPGQPLLVQAGPRAISFTANLLAADTLDPGAADVEAGAAASLTESWRLADAAALPPGGRSFPTQDYTDAAGAVSRNETISYFLRSDTISGRSDIFVLYRRVNARDSVQVVRNLHVPADSAFFSYFRPVGGTLTRIAAERLPLWWDSVAVDSIRAVGIRAAGFYRDRTSGQETIRTVEWRTVLPNAAARGVGGCGAAPAAPAAVGITKVTNARPYRAMVDWDASPDDGAGALDVRTYAVDVRRTGVAWRTIGSVAATGANTYKWSQPLPLDTGSFEYAVRALDCSGSSSRVTTSAVALP
ncbi:MAG: prepilin-type N-terminal cleavage/methylation domain-containing protein [Gemmatimonadaceae bacterium]|nr:prepilin-type N-terminal cleavage/methylation domain-containing protein [Gemmatimonadaceae bacterium]